MARRNTLLEENSGSPAQPVHVLDHSPHFPPLRCQACPPGGCQRAVPAITPHHTHAGAQGNPSERSALCTRGIRRLRVSRTAHRGLRWRLTTRARRLRLVLCESARSRHPPARRTASLTGICRHGQHRLSTEHAPAAVYTTVLRGKLHHGGTPFTHLGGKLLTLGVQHLL